MPPSQQSGRAFSIALLAVSSVFRTIQKIRIVFLKLTLTISVQLPRSSIRMDGSR